MITRLDLLWTSPGPVSTRFMHASASVQILNGPIGSGKTTSALMKAIRLAGAQKPSTRDTAEGAGGRRMPVRKFKLCVVRDTYRQLWKTTLQSWFKRVPRTVGQFTGAENAPASHRVSFLLPDGSVVEFQADFLAIGDQAVEDVLRGYEPTAFYLNELDLLAREVMTYASGRTGRFPDMAEGGPTWHGILADCNAPVLHSWLMDEVFSATPDDLARRGIALFRQPSGLSPNAENLDNLPPGYYAAQSSGPSWYVRRMVENIPGFDRSGKPVYPEFLDTLHVPERELEPVSGLALRIGLDAGLSPAAVFGQRMPNGQWRIIDELVAEHGTGPTRFGEQLAQRLGERFGMIRTIKGFADPSAAYGADRAAGEKDWIEIVEAKSAVRIDPAPTNVPATRWEAVRRPLTRLIDGQPGLLLSPRCRVLRAGFNAGYRFRKLQVVGADRFGDEAEKNAYSHPHDALQYLCSAGGEDIEIRERHQRWGEETRRRATTVEHEWDPLNR